MKAFITKKTAPAHGLPSSPIETLHHLENIKQSLDHFKEQSIFSLPFTRRLKLQPLPRETFDDPYRTVPTFTLCGGWLKHLGFEENRHVRIITLKELLVIFPEAPLT